MNKSTNNKKKLANNKSDNNKKTIKSRKNIKSNLENITNLENTTNLENITNSQIDLNKIFKYFGEMFNNKNIQTNDENNSINNIVVHIRKECIMDIFEYQIKQQLIDITENGLLKKIDERMDSTYDETVKKMDNILLSIEKDPGFINLTLDELYQELENVPSQEDYDYFCNQMSYEKKLNKENSSNREKLFTIMYTIVGNCIGPNINFKKIILSIIKYELTRNELVEFINKNNKDNNKFETLDFITADMMFMSLKHFLSHSNMKIISRNIAYYFSKIC